MGFFKKLTKTLRKVVDPGRILGKVLDPAQLAGKNVGVLKAIAPIAVGFIPGIGPALAPMVAKGLAKRQEIAQARKAFRANKRDMERAAAVAAEGEPNTDLDTMAAVATTQNTYPQPAAYAAPRAYMFQSGTFAALKAKKLIRHSRHRGGIRGLGQRIRIATTAKAIKGAASKRRLRFRFNRAPALHSTLEGAVGPTRRWNILRGRIQGGVSKRTTRGGGLRRVRRSGGRRARRARRAA